MQTGQTVFHVSVQNDTSSGGHKLVVSKDVAVGEVLLRQEADACVLSDIEVSRRCHHSFLRCDKLMRCSSSKFFRYSSRAAQRQHWTRGGQQECAALRACYPRIPVPTIRLAAQIIWRAAVSKQDKQGSKLDMQRVEELLSHWEHLADCQKLKYAQMATLTLEFMKGCSHETSLPSVKQVALLLARISCNCMTISDEELIPIGTGLYLSAAMANHSCNPSCVQSFHGSTLTLRALRPMSEGDEVTISYIDTAATRQERRLSLIKSYFFDIDGFDATPGPFLPENGHHELHQASSNKSSQYPTLMRTLDLPTGITLKVFGTSNHTPGWQCDSLDADLTQISGLFDGSLMMHGRLCFEHNRGSTSCGDFDGSVHFDDLPAKIELESLSIANGYNSTSSQSDSAFPAAALISDDEADVLASVGRVELYCYGSRSFDEQAIREAALLVSQLLRKQFNVEALLKHSKNLEALQAGLQALELAGSTGVCLGPVHILRIRIMQAVQRAAIECRMWKPAIQIASQLTPILTNVYAKRAPLVGLQVATFAKILALQAESPQQLQEAIQMTDQALENLIIAYGRASELVGELERLRDQMNLELR